MRVTVSPTEKSTGRTHRETALIILPATIAIGLAMSFQPFALAEGNSKGIRPQPPTLAAPPTEQKIAGPVVKKTHKLIRRPATTATATLQTSSIINQPSPTSTAKMAEAPIIQSQDGASAQNQSKDSFANKATAPTAFAVPLSSTLVGQTATGVGTTRSPSSLVGSAAAAAPASSTPAASPSMRRLFSEIPGAAQIVAYEDQTPAVTTPTILRNPTAMSFSAVQNGVPPAAQTLTLSNGGTGTATWTASSNSTWLTLNGTSSVAGSNLGSITVAVNPNGLAVGSRSSIITIVGPGSGNSPQTVTVTFDITAAPTPTIGLSATSLSLTATQGGSNPAAKTISISNSGSGTLNWTATENTSWLSLSPASGTGAGTLSISVATAGLTAGTYSAPITIAAGGATNTPSTISVTLTVNAVQNPTIGLSPASLSFTAIQGAGNPTAKTVNLTNTGSGTLSWSVSDNATWLTLNAVSGTTTAETDSISVTINTSGLAAGTYNAAITLTATGGATNTPQTVPVTLTVSAPTTSTATLTWNAVTDTDLVGYKVYRATAAGGYGAPLATVPAGTVTYQTTGLQTGLTYYFVVTAYDTAGNESTLSNEVSKMVN